MVRGLSILVVLFGLSAGTAVAHDLKLGVCWRMKEQGAGDKQQRAKAANVHQYQL